jgi:hypothetical protein
MDIPVAGGVHRLVVPHLNYVPGNVYNLLSAHDMHHELVATLCLIPGEENGELRFPALRGD